MTFPSDARVSYEQEGWYVAPGLMPLELVRELIAAAERLEAEAADFVQPRVLRGVSFELQSASGRPGEPAVHPGALRKIRFPSKRERVFSELRRHPLLLSALAELGLPTPKCMVDQLNYKLPRVGTGFPFHQDQAFVQQSSKDRLEQHGGMNLVLALDPADAGNGGFEVLGRTHHEVVDFPYDRASMNEGVFDESHRQLVPMAPGDVLFFHPVLAHGSGPNRSDRQRRIVTLWFRGGGSAVIAGGRAREPLR